MGESTNGNKKLNIAGGVWLLVLLLALLVMASAALVGSFIKRYISQEKNVVEVMVDSGSIKDKYDDSELPVGAVPGIEGGGDDASWETETSVDLFKNTYTDAEGNVTVQSALGDKVIAPGTTNDYEFNIKNTGNISLDYTVKLDGTFSISEHELPFYVRCRVGDEWLVGSAEKWVKVENLGDAVTTRTLPRGEIDTFVFEWQWPFEVDKESENLIGDLNDTLISADATDTKLGDIAVDVNAVFKLEISTTAVVTPGAVPVYRDGTRVLAELIFVCGMAGLIIGCIVLLIIFFVNRKVYFAAFITPSLKAYTWLDGKESEILNTHSIYPKVKFGAHRFEVADNICEFKLKRGRVEAGVEIALEKELWVVTVDRSIRALELHFTRHFHNNNNATIGNEDWAAIDKKHNVYTPTAVLPADPDTKINRTPGGLAVDGSGKFDVIE